MSKHTPGPWEWDGNVWDYDNKQEAPWLVQAPWTAKESQTVLTGSIECKSEADARLIAAAPDLLEALQLALQALEAIGEEMTVGERYTNAGQYLLDSLNPARAAIAKATGANT